MSWTVLRVVESGVVLRDFHAARFAGHSPEVRRAFDRFCAEAGRGNYSLEAVGDELRVLPRGPSRVVDGLPVRFLVSPIAHLLGPIAKPPRAGPYAALRVDGVNTLLTSSDGGECFESCSAALVGWDGLKITLVPHDRPRVASSAEAALREAGVTSPRPMLRDETTPLALVNAVKGLGLLAMPGRAPFPDEAARTIHAVFDRFTKR